MKRGILALILLGGLAAFNSLLGFSSFETKSFLSISNRSSITFNSLLGFSSFETTLIYLSFVKTPMNLSIPYWDFLVLKLQGFKALWYAPSSLSIPYWDFLVLKPTSFDLWIKFFCQNFQFPIGIF